jgi:hypothetical protein
VRRGRGARSGAHQLLGEKGKFPVENGSTITRSERPAVGSSIAPFDMTHTSRILVLAFISLLSGCVAQVRGQRVQRPFRLAPEGSRIALVSIDVPPWARPASDDPVALLRAAIPAAFEGSSFVVVDQTQRGYVLPIGPKTRPLVFHTAAAFGEVGQPYAFDEDGVVQAVGAPPISWRVVSAPEGFTVDSSSGRVHWTPTERGERDIELAAVNPLGETRYQFRVSVVKPGELKGRVLARPSEPLIAPDQVYAALLPEGRPEDIDAPFLLGVHVVAWKEGTEMVMNSQRRKVYTDVVYSLWARDGRELETIRVRLDQVPLGSFRNAVTLVPARDYWLNWSDARGTVPQMASLDDKLLFRETAAASASAFAFPYGEHKVLFSAQLDESSPALKPGIELSNKEDFEGAFQAFEQVAQESPELAGAYYNMGVMREIQGRDEEALALYRKAYSLNPQEGMYRRQLDALEGRARQRISLELP